MRSKIGFAAGLVAVLLGTASCAAPQVSEASEAPASGWLEFEIHRSFHPRIQFWLRSREYEAKAHLKAKFRSSMEDVASGKGIEQVIEKDISKETCRELFRQAQGLDFKRIICANQPDGLDGSEWTLRLTNGGCTISLSLWSPTYPEEGYERGLEEFLALGKRLLALAEIEIPEDELY